MIRPPYATVFQNYPRRSEYPHGMMLELLGWDDVLNNEAFKDTCAMRVSYALACSGVRLSGARMHAKGKRAKGWPIEPSQGKLSAILRRMWGEPEEYPRQRCSARWHRQARWGRVVLPYPPGRKPGAHRFGDAT